MNVAQPKQEPKPEAELAEYAACQQELDSNSQTFWTIAGIFIGVSSALLAGFIFGILSNSDLVSRFLTTTSIQADRQVWLVRIISIVLSAANIVILIALRRWLKRTNFIQDTYYEYMRHIEHRQCMLKSWLMYAIDKNGDIPSEDKTRLLNYTDDPEWLNKRRNSRDYAHPSRFASFPLIYYTLFYLWIAVTLGTLFLPCFISWLT